MLLAKLAELLALVFRPILDDLLEEKGEHIRLDWANDPPEYTRLADNRSAFGPWTLSQRWKLEYFFQFRHSDHIDINEAWVVLSLVKKLVRAGVSRARIILLSDSRVVDGALAKGRSSSRHLNCILRKVFGYCVLGNVALDIGWLPTDCNPSDAPTRCISLAKLFKTKAPDLGCSQLPRAVPTAATAAELDLLRVPIQTHAT